MLLGIIGPVIFNSDIQYGDGGINKFIILI